MQNRISLANMLTYRRSLHASQLHGAPSGVVGSDDDLLIATSNKSLE